MPDADVLWIIAAVHMTLFAVALLLARKRSLHISFSYYVWMALLPVFGPITGYELIGMTGHAPPDAGWMLSYETQHRLSFTSRLSVQDIVPLEEALLINDPHKRRLLIMNVLHTDPMRYLDLLLVARFNDDTETAHYATATIMELQRNFQLELQHLQLEVENDPADSAKHFAYIETLFKYCKSGLLEGQLLHRQQITLQNALDNAPTLESDPVLLRVKISNCLALKRAEEAKEAARKLIDLCPNDETSWLESMRVYAEIKDRKGMRDLLKNIHKAKIDFTAAGREHLLYYSEAEK